MAGSLCPILSQLRCHSVKLGSGRPPVRRKYYPRLLFLGSLLLLASSASGNAQAIDALLWPIRLGLIAGLSFLLVWFRWRHRQGALADRSNSHDSADRFLSSIRRWYDGEKP